MVYVLIELHRLYGLSVRACIAQEQIYTSQIYLLQRRGRLGLCSFSLCVKIRIFLLHDDSILPRKNPFPQKEFTEPGELKELLSLGFVRAKSFVFCAREREQKIRGASFSLFILRDACKKQEQPSLFWGEKRRRSYVYLSVVVEVY